MRQIFFLLFLSIAGSVEPVARFLPLRQTEINYLSPYPRQSMALFRNTTQLKTALAIATCAMLATSCSREKARTAEEIKAYEKDVDAWYAERIDHVKAEDGWLNLVGLFWLEPG